MKRLLPKHLSPLLLLAWSGWMLASCTDEGDEGRYKILVEPRPEARAAARSLREASPDARVLFSQNTGNILAVLSGPAGFVTGDVSTAEAAFETVREFLAAHPELFRIEGLDRNLRLATQGFTASAARGLVSVRFEQTHEGLLVRERYGTAIFDGSGRLLAVHGRLVPTADLLENPELARQTGTTTQALEIEPVVSVRPGPRPRIERTSEQQLYDYRRGRGLRLLRERVLRSRFGVTRELYDARGRLLERIDETPSTLVTPPETWVLQGSLVESLAHDSQGTPTLIPSTRVGGQLVLGFRLDGILAPDAGVSIADALAGPDPGYVPDLPIATDAADWTEEPEYDTQLRDGTLVARNLRDTLRWFKDNLGLDSWNGRGAPMYVAIRGNRLGAGAGPDLNAYGFDGHILIGDGRTATGRTLGDALDVVAHEFMHSVINATADFMLRGEPGALNESLADVFGVAVEGFKSPLYGDGAGHASRNLLEPWEFDQPATYGEYRNLPFDQDNGGVHVNSGILNRALSTAMTSLGTGGHVSVPRLLLGSLQDIEFSYASSLEEFAAAVSSYCLIRSRMGTLATDAIPEAACEALNEAFAETELLRFEPGLSN